MPVSFVLLGWVFYVTNECVDESSVCIGVLGCGCPILISAIICGMDLRAFTYIFQISDSAANFITTMNIWEIFNTVPLFLMVSLFFKKKTFPICWGLPVQRLWH